MATIPEDDAHPDLRRSRRLRRLEHAVAACSVVTMGLFFTTMVILGAARVWFYYLPTLLVALGLFALSRRLERRASFLHARYVADVSRRDERPPILSLRSFSEPVLTADRPTYHLRGGLSETAGDSFLRAFAEAARPLGRLVALGHPPKGQEAKTHETVFLHTTDEAWLETFALVARASRAVVLIPDVTNGVAQELEFLAQLGLTHKLLVFMPATRLPDPSWTPFRTRDPEAFAKRWAMIRARWAEWGFVLPEYRLDGLLYRVAPDLTPRESRSLSRDLPEAALETALRYLMPAPDADARPLAEILATLNQAATPAR